MSTPVRRAIYGSLTSNGSLTGQLGAAAGGYSYGIYHNAAPDHAKPPYIIFSKSSGVPTDVFGNRSGGTGHLAALENDVWMVKVVDRNSTADTAEAIADLVKNQLNDQALAVGGGGTILYLRRESDVEYSELTDGDLYQHVGALFRLTMG